MSGFFQKLKLAVTDPSLRRRFIFTLGALIVFRLLSNIPIPSIDLFQLERFLNGNQLFGLVNIFSGGGLSNLSIVMLGVGPYITASIIMQLLTFLFPKMKEMYQENGEAGRKKFSQYSRMLSIPLGALQAFAFVILLQKQGVLPSLSHFDMVVNVIVITASSVLLMWIGELITEFGIGNGVSLIIFAGIVSAIPKSIAQAIYSFNQADLPMYVAFFALALFIIYGVVYITEAERPVPVTYAKRVRGNKVFGGVSTYIPLRLNQAGVIPIIFALSMVLLPRMALGFIVASVSNPTVNSIASTLLSLLSNNWVYAGIYFVLVFMFTYFYTAVTFDPTTIATNLQKNGAFIPGVRPGTSTADYLGKIVTRITMVGALFLGIIAVLPVVGQAISGVSSLAIGGTALLIVVSVVIDLVKKIDAQVSMREY